MQQNTDPVVGIYIVDLEITPVFDDGPVYYFHAARIKPGKWVSSHYHSKGDEPYFIYRGTGEANLGWAFRDPPSWRKPFIVRKADSFIVQPIEAHCLRNIGKGDLDFGFACPSSHLDERDRFMVDLPPHFPR